MSNDQAKVSYETPVVLDHGSISDHTFATTCIRIGGHEFCFPGGGGGLSN